MGISLVKRPATEQRTPAQVRVFDEFNRHRVGFAFSKEDLDFTGPIGRLIYQVFRALAEFERETIKMRTEEGRRASALAGNYTGTVAPYGFESVPNPRGKGRKLQIVPAEADVVRKISPGGRQKGARIRLRRDDRNGLPCAGDPDV